VKDPTCLVQVSEGAGLDEAVGCGKTAKGLSGAEFECFNIGFCSCC